MNRRDFLQTTCALGLSAIFAGSKVWAAENAADAAVNAAFEAIFDERLVNAPELASSLGLDKGEHADLKFKLRPRTSERRAADLARDKKAIATLEAMDPEQLSSAGRLNLEVVLYSLKLNAVSPARFGINSVQRPYPIFQQGGAYFQTPDFLNTAHTIDSASDCEAYLARLAAFADTLDQDTEEQKAQAARGFLAPAWSLDLSLGQMAKLRMQDADKSSIVDSLVRRAAAKGISGDWQARAAKLLEKSVYPALDRQIAAVTALKPLSKPGDGALRLPDGAAIYAAALEAATTTTLAPQKVHKLGLEQVADISARLDTILRRAGMKKGTVGARLAALNQAVDQLYANTDESRAALIASLNAGVKDMYARLPRDFRTLPTQPMEIRRVPPEIQDGASNGYYNRAALDGSRPAIYFINLKDVGDWPKYSLPSLTYHEGVPGHHLQISISQESKDIPTLRKIAGFSAYSEGWALYAEQLSDELGAYKGLERAGYLQSFLFRAARLVVDTGLHAKDWSREKAVDYLVETTGFARPRAQREVERYCTQIGQACSYKIGHTTWVRARDKARKALGKRFDVKSFHEILKEGAMPLSILERRINERANSRKRR
jgi:uncharacterized protein (DUF885 family)